MKSEKCRLLTGYQLVLLQINLLIIFSAVMRFNLKQIKVKTIKIIERGVLKRRHHKQIIVSNSLFSVD